MTSKAKVLLACAAILGVLYVIFFTDLFRGKSMQIIPTFRPGRASAIPRPRDSAPVYPMSFRFDKHYRFTNIKIVNAAEYATNKNALPMWHMVSDSNSSPQNTIIYGVPKILVLPWIALVLGLGAGTAVATGALFAVFPVLLMVAAGVRDVDPAMVTVAVSMGATRRQVATKVLLPAVLPSVLAGMRVAVVFALLGVLLAEMFAGVRGMGYLMQRQAVAFKAPELFAATAMVSALSIAVVLFLDSFNRRLGR